MHTQRWLVDEEGRLYMLAWRGTKQRRIYLPRADERDLEVVLAVDYDRDVSETRDTALKDAISAVRGRLVASDFDYGTNAQGLDLACEAIQRLLDGEIDE